MNSLEQVFQEVLNDLTDGIYCNIPCQVVSVNNNYVDVKIFINDDEPDQILYNVPILRQETQRAYIFLGIKEGDRGVCRFFDRSTEGYLQSDFDYNSDDRQHDINDRCFELGFVPDKEAFIYPTDKDIEIGLKNGLIKMSFTENGIDILGNVNITGNLTVSGEVTANYGSETPIQTTKHIHTDTTEPTGNIE